MKVTPLLKSCFTHLKYTVHPDLNVAPAHTQKKHLIVNPRDSSKAPSLTFICRDPDTPVVDPLCPEGCKVGPLWTGLWLVWSVWRSGQPLELSQSHCCWSVFVLWQSTLSCWPEHQGVRFTYSGLVLWVKEHLQENCRWSMLFPLTLCGFSLCLYSASKSNLINWIC